MKPTNMLALASVIVACIAGCDTGTQQPAASTEVQQTPTSSGQFMLEAPAGFEERPEQKVYYHPDIRASIKPAFQEGADFKSIAAEFTKEGLLEQGMQLDERAIVEVNGRSTLFVKGQRIKAPYPQTCAIAVFATSDGCAQLIAIYPTDTSEELQEAIRKAITEARYE